MDFFLLRQLVRLFQVRHESNCEAFTQNTSYPHPTLRSRSYFRIGFIVNQGTTEGMCAVWIVKKIRGENLKTCRFS
jgi:hypothetical protein